MGTKKVMPSTSPVRGVLITLEVAEQKTGMSKAWFYLRMRTGTLPFPWFMPSAGKRLVDSADVDDWLESIKVPTGGVPMKK